MTVLVTSEGHLLKGDPNSPKQLTPSGRQSLARNSVPLSNFGASSLLLLNGKTVSYNDLYRTQPYVAAAVDVLTQQVSRLPLKVYRRNSKGERERVYEHPLVDLIQTPAPRCTPGQLKQWSIMPILLHGNGVLAKSRDERFGPPTRLWPLDWQHLTAYARKGGPIEYWATTQFEERTTVEVDDVVHFRWEPPDGQVGVSPLQQLGITVKIERAAQSYQEGYLQNSARLPGALELPEGVTLESAERDEMREDFVRLHGGGANAGLPAIIPNGVTYKELAGANAHEAALIEQRKLTREEIGAVYKVPQPMLGILDNATYSNIAELHRMLYTTVLGPWLTLIEETIQVQLIDPEPAFSGLFVEFDLAEVLKGDKTKEIAALKLAVGMGLMTLNEARQVQNLPKYDVDWADKPLIPANNLRSAPEPEASADPPSKE
jgi:HK97 family phage portal protein